MESGAWKSRKVLIHFFSETIFGNCRHW